MKIKFDLVRLSVTFTETEISQMTFNRILSNIIFVVIQVIRLFKKITTTLIRCQHPLSKLRCILSVSDSLTAVNDSKCQTDVLFDKDGMKQ